MGYSGLIYAAIVAAWAAFLVPRWVRRNEEVERAREADAARGVRVLQRRTGPTQATHDGIVGSTGERMVLHGSPAGLVVGAGPPVEPYRPAEEPGPAQVVREPSAASSSVASSAAARRRRMVVALLLGTVTTAVAAGAGWVAGWAPLVPVGATIVFLFLARRAAVAEAHRRRLDARRPVAPRRMSEPAVVEPGAFADEADEMAGRRLVIPDEAAEDVDAADGWQPVPVPLPTYLTKPKAPRVARKIDLSLPGAWTSGSLDPASSIELPRRDQAGQPSASADEPQTEQQVAHRRAVGD